MVIITKFDFGDRVKIDNGDIIATVIGVWLQGEQQKVTVEVSWFHNGEVKTAWLFEWRLEKVA